MLPLNLVPFGYISSLNVLMSWQTWSRFAREGCKSDSTGDDCVLDQPSTCFSPHMKPESSTMSQGVASASHHSILSNKSLKTAMIAGGVMSSAGGG